jgi:hypothetical protein
MAHGSEGDIEKPSNTRLEDVANTPFDEKQSSGSSPPTDNAEMENRILRKMDIRIIPMLATLYLLAFLDRGNIGNAKIEGLLDDLHMTGPQYNWCCMVT